MNYRNYEEYMRGALGYSPFIESEDTYDTKQSFQTPFDLSKFYPEIYKLIYPMISKICNENFNKEFTNDLLNEMVDEIYVNFEPNDEYKEEVSLKNGDVINPNSREVELTESRQVNFLLKDLIRILIIREWEKMVRNYIKPTMHQTGRTQMYEYHRPINRKNNRNFSRRPRYY